MKPQGEDRMFLKIGHRGAKAYQAENTMESFKKGIQLGANAIEMDVRRSKDGKLVIIHDENLKRVFGKDIRVDEATLHELKQLTENKILTLEEALKFIDRKVEKILVELKEVGYEGRVLEVIKEEGLSDRVIIASFHESALADVRKADARIATGFIYSRSKNPLDAALKLNANFLIPFYRFTHTRDISEAHKHNLKVIVWTINTKQEAEEYIAKGVDGIASDKPDIFRDILKA
jgi:glycerophosphoryl diester phosphodiesterase